MSCPSSSSNTSKGMASTNPAVQIKCMRYPPVRQSPFWELSWAAQFRILTACSSATLSIGPQYRPCCHAIGVFVASTTSSSCPGNLRDEPDALSCCSWALTQIVCVPSWRSRPHLWSDIRNQASGAQHATVITANLHSNLSFPNETTQTLVEQ